MNSYLEFRYKSEWFFYSFDRLIQFQHCFVLFHYMYHGWGYVSKPSLSSGVSKEMWGHRWTVPGINHLKTWINSLKLFEHQVYVIRSGIRLFVMVLLMLTLKIWSKLLTQWVECWVTTIVSYVGGGGQVTQDRLCYELFGEAIAVIPNIPQLTPTCHQKFTLLFYLVVHWSGKLKPRSPTS